MIKKMLLVKKDMSISPYQNLRNFKKTKNVGHVKKQAKAFEAKEVDTFLTNAPDKDFLHIKVAAVFGICGATGREELYDLTTKHVQDKGTHLFVLLSDTKTHKDRSFSVEDPYCEIVKKYMKLRPSNPKTDSFFLHYKNGKCTKQNIGVNTIGGFPAQIAEYLQLKDTSHYTGHSFRRSFATLLADSGAPIETMKRHGGWGSTTVAEEYVEESEGNERQICNQIMGEVQGSSMNSSNNPSSAKKLRLSVGDGNAASSKADNSIHFVFSSMN